MMSSMKATLFWGVLCAVGCGLLTGCASSSSPRRIEAGGVHAITTMNVDLRDCMEAAGKLTQAILNLPQVTGFEAEYGRLPVVAVGEIINDTGLSLNMAQIAGRVNEDLLNSGTVLIMAVDKAAKDANEKDTRLYGNGLNRAIDADFYLEGKILQTEAVSSECTQKTYTFQIRLNNRQLLTIFQKSVDVSKLNNRPSAIGW